MPTTYINAFYLGVRPDMDPNESSIGSENNGGFTGTTIGSAGAPLYNDVIRFGMNDADGDGHIWDNGFGNTPEKIVYNGVSSGLDTLLQWDVTLTYTDGTTANTRMTMVQDVSGRVFLVPSATGSTYNAPLDDKAIRSITFNTITQTQYDNLLTARPDIAYVCFAAGTLIEAATGPVRVEDLAVGDLVRTLDDGMQPIRWIRARHLEAAQLARSRDQMPIRIAAGALGQGLPRRDLLVSPQHRILIRGPIAARMAGAPEVLVAAKHLCVLPGISVRGDISDIDYVHFLLDRHQIVFAEGALAESLYPGKEALKSIGRAARARLLTIFPELRGRDPVPWPPVRPLLRGTAAAQLALRHAKNNKPLLDTTLAAPAGPGAVAAQPPG